MGISKFRSFKNTVSVIQMGLPSFWFKRFGFNFNHLIGSIFHRRCWPITDLIYFYCFHILHLGEALNPSTSKSSPEGDTKNAIMRRESSAEATAPLLSV